jgi:hypothetical protein
MRLVGGPGSAPGRGRPSQERRLRPVRLAPRGLQLLFHLLSRLHEHTSVMITANLDFAE